MGFKFKEVYPTPIEHSQGKNTCEYIILHHTATGEGTIKGVIDGLYRRPDYASCHFVVDTNGDVYKIGEPTDILWHAGESSWDGKVNLNNYSMGIEFIGPLKDGGFTSEQFVMGNWLIQHLMSVFNIPNTKVIRHKDIAPRRKTDIADTYWNKKFKTFNEYTATLKPRKWD